MPLGCSIKEERKQGLPWAVAGFWDIAMGVRSFKGFGVKGFYLGFWEGVLVLGAGGFGLQVCSGFQAATCRLKCNVDS